MSSLNDNHLAERKILEYSQNNFYVWMSYKSFCVCVGVLIILVHFVWSHLWFLVCVCMTIHVPSGWFGVVSWLYVHRCVAEGRGSRETVGDLADSFFFLLCVEMVYHHHCIMKKILSFSWSNDDDKCFHSTNNKKQITCHQTSRRR